MYAHKGRPLVGVIDIGSNSVRFVVYDGLKRVPRQLFNEKTPCGLGHGVAQTGRLEEAAKEKARRCIRRYTYLSRTIGLDSLYAVATAAIRDAADGSAFVKELEKENGIKIDIITGEREAYLAAQGIFASMYQPKGVAADLGGGSLEVVELGGDTITHQHTMPLGTLRILDECGKDPDRMRAHIRDVLSHTGWFRRHYKRFYAIGGGFRSLARVHMKLHRYPLSLVHHYEVKADDLFPFLSHLLTLKEKERGDLKGLSSRRLEGFVPSVVVLEEILRATGARSTVFSNAGIREGLLYDMLPAEEHDTGVLTASLSNLTGREMVDSAYSHALFAWQQPLFELESPALRRIRRAACQLNEIALPVSPEFRGVWAFEHILQSSLYGVSHRERVALALALYYRYRKKYTMNRNILGLLEKRDLQWAQLAGQSADIAFILSAGTLELLNQLRLEVSGGKVLLTGKEEALKMVPATLMKRLEGLGEIRNAFVSLSK